MKQKVAALCFFAIFLTSCISLKTITRWPDEDQEQRSQIISAELRPDIFKDFLWTTPDVQSRQLELSSSNTSQFFSFAGVEYSVEILTDGTMTLSDGNKTLVSDLNSTKNDRYFDISRLSYKLKTMQRWVPKTVHVMEVVPVQKTRMVTDTYVNADGTMGTRMRTEFYTDFENRMVMKTEWVWENYTVSFVDIPRYSYYSFTLDSGIRLNIYEVSEGGQDKYYLQNSSYISGLIKEQGFFKEDDIRVMLIDADSDGDFNGKTDLILFNVWNPYAEDSEYREIPNLMDNKWFKRENLVKDLFMNVISKDNSAISIVNENDSYMDLEEEGRLYIINNTDDDIDLFVNGEQYFDADPGENTYRIQQGLFSLTLEPEDHLPIKKRFVIDQDQMEQTIVVDALQQACGIEIRNVFAENWYVDLENLENGESQSYYKKNQLMVPAGDYKLTVIVNGSSLSFKYQLKDQQRILLDFEKELKKLAK